MLHGTWLLLVHQLPPKPSNIRVRIWRRLQELGAVAVKSSVYALPNSPSAQEDFAWMKTEITSLGGQATIFAADGVDTWSDDELKQAFRVARKADYDELVRTATDAIKAVAADALLRGPRRTRIQRVARMVQERLTHVRAIDFFGAAGGDEATAALTALERRLAPADRRHDSAAAAAAEGQIADVRAFRRRLWVTRPRPGVDRMASAWLIRKCIDAEARFAFAAPDVRAPKKALTFDTYNGDFTHEGARCTFEVLTQRFGIADPVIARVGEIVHDVDLKDARFGAAEATAIGPLIEGLRRVHADDQELLEQGILLFEALYQGLQADLQADTARTQPTGGRRSGRTRRAARAPATRKRSGKT